MSPQFTAPPVEPLRLKDAKLLLQHDYLPFEAGYAINADDWFFGWVYRTDQYKLWHPRDHVFSDWEGPRGNDSTYIGGYHLVHEYIGGQLAKLKILFRDPGDYFGEGWQDAFKEAGYSTAVCARVGNWDPNDGSVVYTGHLIHLVKEEPDGCRMRSRFWLGDVDGVTDPEARAAGVPEFLPKGL